MELLSLENRAELSQVVLATATSDDMVLLVRRSGVSLIASLFIN